MSYVEALVDAAVTACVASAEEVAAYCAINYKNDGKMTLFYDIEEVLVQYFKWNSHIIPL